MSFSSHRRDALDPAMPLNHRASHARSCAMLVGEKWRVRHSIVFAAVQRECAVNLEAISSDIQIATAMTVLEELRQNGVPNEH